LIEKLRKSLFSLHELPPDLEWAVHSLYRDALRIAFAASSAFAFLSFLFSLAQKTGALRRKGTPQEEEGQDRKSSMEESS